MTSFLLTRPGRTRKGRLARTALIGLAQLGYTQQFFGNLYEAVVRIPHRLSETRDLAAPAGQRVSLAVLLRPGSPVRYHLPAIPVIAVGTLGSLAAMWRTPARRWAVAASCCGAVAGLVTAHIVRDIGWKLFFASAPPAPAEREQLLRTWYRLNAVRLLAAVAAWSAFQRARGTAEPG